MTLVPYEVYLATDFPSTLPTVIVYILAVIEKLFELELNPEFPAANT